MVLLRRPSRFCIDINFFFAAWQKSKGQSDERSRADPDGGLRFQRVTNFSRNVEFVTQSIQLALEPIARQIDLAFYLFAWFARFLSHSLSFFNSSALARNMGFVIRL